MKRTLSFLLTLLMLVTSLPLNALTVLAEELTAEETSPLTGKTISILGASISTYAGTSNGKGAETTNSTIAGNVKYYPNTTIPEVTLEDTWWMQTAEDLGLRLLVNNAWSGSAILPERSGTVGAYVDRCVQLHDDTGENAGEEPDIICIQMGFNDFSYGKDTLGNAEIDYDTLITADGYGTPSTTMEATAIMLHKMTKRYPNAEIYMFNHFKRIGQSASDTALMEELNASIETVCARYGVAVVDLYSTLTDPKHIGDGKLHPNRLGMDVITEAVKTAILENTKYTASCHTVSMDLENATADYGTDKLVMDGDSFTLHLESPDELRVSVTMGGKDITSSVYADGAISISAVTGDVKISAKGVHQPKHYRWEFDGTDLVAAIGDNTLTKTAGTTAEGVFSDTMYDLESPIVLRHDLPWQVEWKCQGTWKDESSASGGRLFTSTPVNAEYNARYLFKSATKWLIAMGEKTTTGSHNYGIALEDYGIDGSALHTYRLENQVAADGSNMVYLFVDGKEIGAMNHYYVGTTDKKTTSDWLSGKDFALPYFGTDTHGLTNCSVEYIEVWECDHSYQSTVTPPTLNAQGYTTYTCTACGDSYVSDYTDKLENLWSSRSAVFVGDSITAGVGTTKLYYQFLEEALDFSSVTAMGVGGSCFSAASDYGQKNQPLINRYQSIPTADLIVIFMGTNDYGHETPLGTLSDTGDGTFYGALNTIIPALVQKHTSSKIVFVTSLHRYGLGTSGILGTAFTYDHIPNGVGATLGDYVNALKTVCANNGVAVIDLYTECTLDPTDAEVRATYMPDGLHPNAAGHEVIAGIMESHILGYTPVAEEPISAPEMIQGNKFASGNTQPCRASSYANYYLKAGAVITLKNPDVMQWACAKTSGEYTTDNLGYFPEKQWTDITTAVVAEDGWIGFTFKYRDETQAFDLTRPLSDFITIHTHVYTATVTPPTCTEQGYTTYTCLCGDSYVADEAAATGHSYTSITTQPTATTQGYTTYTCEVCGDSYVADYTDFTGFDSYQEAVKYLREQMVARVPSVTVRLYGVQLDENQVYNFRNDAWAHTGVPYEGDYIRQNCLATSCSAVTGTDDKGIYTEMYFNTTWFTTAAQEAEVDAAVADLLAEWNLWNATDYQKIKCAYDWVCTNVVYDHDNLYDNTYLLKHSSYAALIHGKAVCQGFASLFYRLCLELGVDCRVITGQTDESHAWNIVKLGDKYYNMDPTYDRGTGNYYRYFLTTIYSFGGHDRNAEYETDAFNAAYPMATLPYVEKVAASGTLSNGMEWILDGDTGVLTVTGNGAIPDYRQWNAPWEPYSDSILGIELSEGITQVGDRAFAWCKNATYLSLPSTLKVICEYGFNNCRSLTEVDLPDGLTTLEFCAFSECSGLTGVYVSAKLTNIGSSVFSNCPNIATIEFGEGFTHIADSMFSNTAVKELILPDTIVSIGSSAFARCEKLTYVRIPASVTYISHSAFINCSRLRQIGVVSDNPNYLSSFGVLFTKDAKTLVCFPAGMIPDRGTYTIPTGVTTIGDSAFYGASHVTRLVIPDSVTLIDDYAFAFCDGLYSVEIGPNVTRLGDTTFGFCTALTSITFANPKMEIDNYCFTHCTKLKSFTFPAEISKLSPGTLTDCHAITEIQIPKNVSVIASGCFQFMKSLKKVTIPANITKLENCAFFNCTALEEVVIEGNLSYMDWSAFDTCSNLKFIHFKGSVASYATITDRELFRDCPVLFAVYFDDLATAKKVTSATAFGNLCKNALTVAVPAGSTGLSSFITTNYPIRSTISKDGVSYDLYSKHTCSWSTTGSAVAVGCERRTPQYCTICRGKKDAITYVHSYTTTYDPPSCTEDGKYTYTCTACGYSFEEWIPAEGHYYDYVITDPTCTEEGRYDYFCIYCDHTYTEPIPPLGHSFEAWYVTKEATCTTAGERRRDCLACGLSETETIPAFGHDLAVYQGKEPTCTEIGWKAYEACLLCGYTTYAELPALGHSYESVVTKPTCTEQGFTTYTCKICGDSYVADETAATGHSYQVAVTKPTCTAEGYTTYTCHCGDSYVADKVPATGHSFGEWTTTKEATCTANGEQRRDCKNCDHFETKAIAATGHSYKATVTKPTCTAEGYTTYTCHCGDSYVADKVPAKGHTFGEWTTTKDATCTANGEQRRDCANCDHYETKVIPATGHSYQAKVTKPTCTTEGYTTYTCHCGDSYVADKVPATGHSFGEWTTTKEATCTVNGEQRRDCKNCDHFETKAIPATGHSYKATVTKPTCTTEGFTTYTCHCGDSYVADKVPATGHNWDGGVVTKEPTEETEGTKLYTCTACGETRTEVIPTLDHVHRYETKVTQPTCTTEGYTTYTCRCGDTYVADIVPALGHDYQATITKPTCTAEGYTTYTCHCGDTYVADKTPATGHSFGEWETVKNATCTANGEQRRDCKNCDHFETKVIAATGHSYKATVTKPTCTTEGYTTYTCHCGYSYVADKVSATGHSFGNWETTKEATCTANGEQRRECKNCDHFETKAIPATGHSYASVVTKPTCTTEGYTTYTCHCGDSYVADKVPATGHSFGEWETVKDATCTVDGEQRRDCKNCDHFETKVIPATGHTYQATVTKPTCTREGYTTYTCHCGDSYVADKVPATGHSFGEWETVKDATCTTNGEQSRECKNCDHFEAKAIPATGHSYKATVTKPSCTAEGYTTYTCHCGDSYVADKVPAKGHTFGEWTITKEATCTANGGQRRECANCDHIETKAIAATGHSYQAKVTKPTCTEDGYTTYTCHCGDSYVADKTPATGHTYQATVTNPTCTEKGYVTYTCHCGDNYVGNYTPATGHAWDGGVVTQKPTEDTTGTKVFTCTTCGETRTETLPRLDHVHKYEAFVTPPTCTADGYTTYTCHCGDSYVADKTPATGHTFGEWETVKEATCTVNGEQRRDCNNCDHYEIQTLAATGHKYDAVVTAPTCTEKGFTTYKCHCGDTYVDNYVDPTGHAWTEWHDTTPGKEERSCTACGKTESRDKVPNFDVDGNGVVEQADVELLMSILVGNVAPDVLHDFDFDGILTIYDCVLLMQQLS